MCGIAGWFGHNLSCDSDVLTAALRHRGPDGEGVWRDPEHRATLVHTRLAIIDPSSAGAQPMGQSEIHGDVEHAQASSRERIPYWLIAYEVGRKSILPLPAEQHSIFGSSGICVGDFGAF